jgi:hypothetical protein
VPEFPLKRHENNRSTNADYLLFDHTPGSQRWILFELKTDNRAFEKKQIAVYRRSMSRGMPQLVQDVRAIRAASKQKVKYDSLLSRVERHPTDRPVHLVYLSPASLTHKLSGADEHSITFRDVLGAGGQYLLARLYREAACARPDPRSAGSPVRARVRDSEQRVGLVGAGVLCCRAQA